MMSKAVLLFVALCILALGVSATSFANKITNLPNYDGPELSMYSGYVTLENDNTLGRNIFYWLIESESEPSKDPLIFWFQGGPGCSGLGGLFTETGPLRPTPSGGLNYTNLGWTQFANMVFLEQPFGVGYSYTLTGTDYKNMTDETSAIYNYQFVQGFLELFPNYTGRDIWLTGESYGGIYIPGLSQQIVQGSNSAVRNAFAGFMVGNPVICQDSFTNNDIQVKTWFFHGLVSIVSYMDWMEANCDQDWNTKECERLFNIINKEVGPVVQPVYSSKQAVADAPVARENYPSLDPDDLYTDFCTNNGTLQWTVDDPDNNPPCPDNLDVLVTNYLNDKTVRSALSVSEDAPYRWSICSDFVSEHYRATWSTVIPLYEEFFEATPPVNILIYSGDIDTATCPFTGSDYCLAALNQTEKASFRPWFVNQETAGYWKQYDKYDYAHVKGAGHETPEYQPLNAFNMAVRYITNRSLNLPTDPTPVSRPVIKRRKQGTVLRELLHKHEQQVYNSQL